jgi:glycosyltransferase involved in cell wall biosynthesis
VPPVTVTVITKNEAHCLADALRSVSWADELIVVDAESTDDTVAVARRFTDRVFIRPWNGYSEQKDHAASLARNDWILSLDADEEVTPALAQQIRQTLAGEPDARGYRVLRLNFHLGCWIRTTDWYPDYQLRLYDRRTSHWNGRVVHESVTVQGPVKHLSGELLHHPYRDLSEQLSKMDLYATLSAEHMRRRGARATLTGLIAHPPLAFLRNYVLKRGFTDGKAGLIISLVNSYYVMLKHAKLWEMERSTSKKADRDPSAGMPSPPSRG